MFDNHLQRTVSWVPGWMSPFEGSVSLLMKFAWVNSYDNGRTLETVFIGCRERRTSPLLGYRSLLHLDWARKAKWTPNFMGERLLLESYISNRWWRALASDSRLRYCATCADSGYQSSLFQLEALCRCPIHGDFLLDVCRHCGSLTRAYACGNTSFFNGLICSGCNRPYGSNVSPTGWLRAEQHHLIYRRMRPIVAWLEKLQISLNSNAVEDESVETWLTKDEQTRRRLTIFAMLDAAHPFTGDREIFLPQKALHLTPSNSRQTPSKQPNRRILQAASTEFHTLSDLNLHVTDSADRQSNVRRVLGKSGDVRHLYGFYKAVRRHILKTINHRRRLRHQRPLRIADTSQLSANCLDDYAVEAAHVLATWRNRFEELSYRGTYPYIQLRSDIITWCLEHNPDDASWAGYVIAGLCESLTTNRRLCMPGKDAVLRHVTLGRIIDLLG